ncbi:MAG: hypothetical protein NVS2B6_18180 [Thermoleophilaceae bacterium]
MAIALTGAGGTVRKIARTPASARTAINNCTVTRGHSPAILERRLDLRTIAVAALIARS